MRRRAAFLDRDGTLNVRAPEHRYLCSVDEFRWLPGAADGAARLALAGFTLVVVSNQRGLALGSVTEVVLREIEHRIQESLQQRGCTVESFRYCPHDLEEHCACRKPKPGLLLAAADDLGLDLASSWMIGDSDTDVQAGHGAGCRAALVGTVHGESAAELHAETLLAASELIVQWEPGRAA
jgi:histidinol-phosphate phosphatase family protein